MESSPITGMDGFNLNEGLNQKLRFNPKDIDQAQICVLVHLPCIKDMMNLPLNDSKDPKEFKIVHIIKFVMSRNK